MTRVMALTVRRSAPPAVILGTTMTTKTPDPSGLLSVALVTLGCARNEVDSEELAGRLEADGFRLVEDASEIPDRIRDQVLLINPTCVFPHCSRPSRGLDLDHVIPWPLGPTATDNLAPLCRSHHRAKTFGGWRYRVITPGTYAWRSPHGYTYRTDRSGTTDTGPDPGR